MVSCQMLSELEEGCQRIVEDWQRILMVRSLVINPHEDMRTWLKYASLCGKSGRLALAHKTLVLLLGVDPSKQLDHPLPTTHPHVTYAYMKYMWKSTHKIEAFQHMQHFVQGMQQQAQHAIAAEDQQHKLELHKLMARSEPHHHPPPGQHLTHPPPSSQSASPPPLWLTTTDPPPGSSPPPPPGSVGPPPFLQGQCSPPTTPPVSSSPHHPPQVSSPPPPSRSVAHHHHPSRSATSTTTPPRFRAHQPPPGPAPHHHPPLGQ
ncbi:hypothetical protein CRUP_032805 [Coryphaenoides rupestris]|nr:hypothetical protein CRUP_032805 [Coryphaenoides rupestris]